MIFEIQGPFEVYTRPTKNGPRVIDTKRINKEFWESISDLSQMKGCYVFAAKTPRSYMPWYVGRTKKNFRKECFGNHQVLKYNEVYQDHIKKGKAVMFLIHRERTLDKRGRLNEKAIEELEVFLIQTAPERNPRLLNKQNNKVAAWSIKGVLRTTGAARPTKAESAFKELLTL